MRFTNLKLKNWRNFTNVDVPLSDRVFLVGPNAAGKSNFLDVFRFLRDLVKTGGGLQKAVVSRGGLGKLRSLFARRDPKIQIEVVLEEAGNGKSNWTYKLALGQEQHGLHRPVIDKEEISHDGVVILTRPDADDRDDKELLTETHLEQISKNKAFRGIATTFEDILYLHLVPQLLKHPELANRESSGEDPFGLRFLERIMETSEKTRRARLRKIESALQIAVPEFQELQDVRDQITGAPHLEAVYRHWRPNSGRQQEDQFSDGTLRLLGLLWSLLDGQSLLLLEEPEISLHSEIVRKLPSLIARVLLKSKNRRQVFLTTHSYELLSDSGIRPEEVILVRQSSSEGSEVRSAASLKEIVQLLKSGELNPAEAILPFTRPSNDFQLELSLQ